MKIEVKDHVQYLVDQEFKLARALKGSQIYLGSDLNLYYADGRGIIDKTEETNVCKTTESK